MLVLTANIFSGCGAASNTFHKRLNGLGTQKLCCVYSGGIAVKTYHVRNGFVNSETNTDGWYFYVDGRLVRLSGTVVIEQE
jgi:hypothetical protein